MMRDWLNAFRPASFRGVPFKVDIEGAEGARRLSVSPIAYAETSVIEDMGRSPRRYDLSAYLAGDIADFEAQALVAALDRKGQGLLVLPMLPPALARVEQWRLSRERRLAGHVVLDILLIEAGLSAAPSGLSIGAGFFGDVMSEGAAILSRVF